MHIGKTDAGESSTDVTIISASGESDVRSRESVPVCVRGLR
jgi:hypothetical protein